MSQGRPGKGPLVRVVKREPLSASEGRGTMRVTLSCGHVLFRPSEQWPTKSCYCLSCQQGLPPGEAQGEALEVLAAPYGDLQRGQRPAAEQLKIPRAVLERWLQQVEDPWLPGYSKTSLAKEMRKYL